MNNRDISGREREIGRSTGTNGTVIGRDGVASNPKPVFRGYKSESPKRSPEQKESSEVVDNHRGSNNTNNYPSNPNAKANLKAETNFNSNGVKQNESDIGVETSTERRAPNAKPKGNAVASSGSKVVGNHRGSNNTNNYRSNSNAKANLKAETDYGSNIVKSKPNNEVCRHDRTCYQQYCRLIHSIGCCKRWNDCNYFSCAFRHGHGRNKPCRFGRECIHKETTCMLLHPTVVFCSFGSTCTNFDCTKGHAVALCDKWLECDEYACILRHSQGRAGKCKFGVDCFFPGCRNGIHPPLCQRDNCLRMICPSRHEGSSLQILLLKDRKNLSSFLCNLMSLAQSAREKHIKKMEKLKSRYFLLQQKISEGDDEDDNYKILEAFVKEGYELQGQLDYFDKSVNASLRQVMSLNSQNPTVQAFKKHIVDVVHREIYRLNAALPSLSLRRQVEIELDRSQFLVVKGETGSGKSTQLPQYVLEILKNKKILDKKVICTQPRKVSATSLAERVAFEWGAGNRDSKFHAVGQTVGYRVGSMRKTSHKTRIEYWTEGAFLKSLLSIFDGGNRSDPLRDVGVIIIDEAHERSISCDIILGILQDLAPTRWRDIKIIVTSATLDTELFCNYFFGCPMVEIPGRMFPVDVIYHPIANATFGVDSDPNIYIQSCVDLAFQLHVSLSQDDGDILCFLTGQDEVEKAKDWLERKLRSFKHLHFEAEVMMLYGKQSPDEQKLVFDPLPNKRKIVFSTDVAETGVTIDGIRHVIDTGLSKESRYDPKRNVTILEIDSICKSSATQRKGRAGRTAPGTCYRLYKEDDFDSMDNTQTAEVLCRPLTLTLLNLISMGIRKPSEFNWMEPPNSSAVDIALIELEMLDCISKEDSIFGVLGYVLTDFGKVVVTLQIDPCMAKVIYSAALEGKGRQGCILAGILSVVNNFYWRGGSSEAKAAADAKHLEFASEKGDLVGMFNAFQEWKEVVLNSSSRPRSGKCASGISETNAPFVDEDETESCDIEPTTVEEFVLTQELIDNQQRMNALFMNRQGNLSSLQIDEDSDDDTNSASCFDDTRSETSHFTNVSEELAMTEVDEDEINNAAIAQMEEEERLFRKNAGNYASRKWCSEHCVNSKSLQAALATANELIMELNRLPVDSFWKIRAQTGNISNDISRLFFQGYFMNIAVQIKNNRIYSVVRQDNNTAYIHPGSSIVKQLQGKLKKQSQNNVEWPQYIVFHSILSTSKSFMTCVIPISPDWLANTPEQFRGLIDSRIACVPTDLVRIPFVSSTIAKQLIGKGGRIKKAFESKYQCSMQYDEQTFTLEIWCNSTRKTEIEQALKATIQTRRMEALSAKEEDLVFNSVRAVYTAGYNVQRFLFADEFTSLHLTGIPHDKSEADIRDFVMRITAVTLDHVELLHRDESDGVCALIRFESPQDSDIIKEKLNNEIWETSVLTVSNAGVRPTTQPSTSMAQLVMTWSLSQSAGQAIVEFNSAQAANQILSRSQEFSNEFRFLLGSFQVTPIGKSLQTVRKNISNKNPDSPSKSIPIVVNGRFQDSLLSVTTSYCVKLTCIQPDVDEFIIKESIQGFLTRLGVKDRKYWPVRVHVKRQDVNENNEILAVQVAQLQQLIPNPESMVCDALSFFDSGHRGRGGFYLRYNSIEDTQLALQQWNQNIEGKAFRFNGQPVRMEAQYTTVISIHESLWRDIANPFMDIASKAMSDFQTLSITPRDCKKNVMVPRKQFRIQSDRVLINSSVCDQLQALVTPAIYQPETEEMRNIMFSAPVTKGLKQISDRETYVHWDKQKQTIYVYGISEEKRKNGILAITRLLTDMLTRFKKFRMVFSGHKRAAEFITKWKVKCNEQPFVDTIAWNRVIRRPREACVDFVGTTAGQEQIEQWFQQQKFSDKNSNRANISAALETRTLCSICEFEIDDNPHFLGGCSHGGCKSCLEGQFYSANNKEFVDTPIYCQMCTPRCLMTLQDIRCLANNTGVETIKRCAVNKYLRENELIAIRCPNSGKCDNILDCRKMKQADARDTLGQKQLGGSKVISCDACNETFCLECTDYYHKATKVHKQETCKESQDFGPSSVRQHRNRLLDSCNLKCPYCKVAFYDFTGCCAVTCNCKKAFCGLCLAACGDNAHPHVLNCKLNIHQGNYFNSADEIRAANRLVRIETLNNLMSTVPNDIKEDVLLSIQPDLRDFNISINDIS